MAAREIPLSTESWNVLQKLARGSTLVARRTFPHPHTFHLSKPPGSREPGDRGPQMNLYGIPFSRFRHHDPIVRENARLQLAQLRASTGSQANRQARRERRRAS